MSARKLSLQALAASACLTASSPLASEESAGKTHVHLGTEVSPRAYMEPFTWNPADPAALLEVSFVVKDGVVYRE